MESIPDFGKCVNLTKDVILKDNPNENLLDKLLHDHFVEGCTLLFSDSEEESQRAWEKREKLEKEIDDYIASNPEESGPIMEAYHKALNV